MALAISIQFHICNIEKATDNDGSCTYSGQGVITTGTSNDQTGTGVGGISSVTFPLTYSNIPKTGDKTYSLIIKNPADWKLHLM